MIQAWRKMRMRILFIIDIVLRYIDKYLAFFFLPTIEQVDFTQVAEMSFDNSEEELSLL